MRSLNERLFYIPLILAFAFDARAFFKASSSSSLSQVKSTVSAEGLFAPVEPVIWDLIVDFGKSSVIISKKNSQTIEITF